MRSALAVPFASSRYHIPGQKARDVVIEGGLIDREKPIKVEAVEGARVSSGRLELADRATSLHPVGISR